MTRVNIEVDYQRRLIEGLTSSRKDVKKFEVQVLNNGQRPEPKEDAKNLC